MGLGLRHAEKGCSLVCAFLLVRGSSSLAAVACSARSCVAAA